MNLATDLLAQLNEPNLDHKTRVQILCRLAKALEESGDYEAARDALGELWQRIGERPKLDGLDEHAAALVLLRAGTLSGWLGSVRQVEGAQEIAKNLISESIVVFERLKDVEKLAEARINLATCYWREGAFDEARVILQEVRTLPL